MPISFQLPLLPPCKPHSINMPSTLPPPLTADEIDDLIYYTRIADLPALKCEVSALSTVHHCGADAVLGVAVDEDSGNCLLHYAGGNGSEGTLCPLSYPVLAALRYEIADRSRYIEVPPLTSANGRSDTHAAGQLRQSSG
jgi:hypothetical protein